jgi:hypothetical protein
LILPLPELHQQNEPWDYAGELLLQATQREGKVRVEVATIQLERASKAEGLL